MKPDIQSPKPRRVKNHVSNIVPLRRQIHLEMSSGYQPSPLQSYVPSLRYSGEDFLQVWNVLHRDFHRERLPVQDVAERRDIVVLDEHRDTACVKSFHHSWTGNLVSTGAYAELGLSQHFIVRNSLGKEGRIRGPSLDLSCEMAKSPYVDRASGNIVRVVRLVYSMRSCSYCSPSFSQISFQPFQIPELPFDCYL
nr:SRSF protein kinase 2 [Ipomoea batatas]GME09080.1 SRSF protein kinase 2 [Ipomoea batatas]